MFMSKQPLKSEILDNPAFRNKAAQLTLMQRNMPSSEGSVETADGVVHTEPVLTEREKEVVLLYFLIYYHLISFETGL